MAWGHLLPSTTLLRGNNAQLFHGLPNQPQQHKQVWNVGEESQKVPNVISNLVVTPKAPRMSFPRLEANRGPETSGCQLCVRTLFCFFGKHWGGGLWTMHDWLILRRQKPKRLEGQTQLVKANIHYVQTFRIKSPLGRQSHFFVYKMLLKKQGGERGRDHLHPIPSWHCCGKVPPDRRHGENSF